MIAVLLLSAALGALAFRVRGGLVTDRVPGFSGQAQRLIYAGLMAAVVALSWDGEPWYATVLLAPAWFAGAAAFGTFGAIDGGRNEGTRLGDFARNAARGALHALPAAAVLLLFGRGWASLLLPAAGLLQGACYELAHRLRPMPAHPATAYAEWATGACLGTGAALAAFV